MSIRDEILDRHKRGMLRLLEPKAAGTSSRRAMFLEERVWEIVDSPEGHADWEERVGKLRADLERFVTGEPIDPKYLFLLYPPDDAIWEIRSVRDEPSIRVLGLFPERDVFVATNIALREDLEGWESREWKEVKRTARARWLHLFPTYQPIRSTKIGDLVTGALNDKYFRD